MQRISSVLERSFLISGILFVRVNVTVPLQVLRIVRKPDLTNTDITVAIVHNRSTFHRCPVFATCDSRIRAPCVLARCELPVQFVQSREFWFISDWFVHFSGFETAVSSCRKSRRKKKSSLLLGLPLLDGTRRFSAVECSRFDGGTVSVGGIDGLLMTVRAIFARHVSPLMHRRNRPVQARPGGLCVGRVCCCLPYERGHSRASACLNSEGGSAK